MATFGSSRPEHCSTDDSARELGRNDPDAGETTHIGAQNNNFTDFITSSLTSTCPLAYRHCTQPSLSQLNMWASTQNISSSSQLPIESLAATLRSSSLSPSAIANPPESSDSSKPHTMASSRWAPVNENVLPYGAVPSAIPHARVTPRVSSLSNHQASVNKPPSSQAGAVQPTTKVGHAAETSGANTFNAVPKSLTTSQLNSQASTQLRAETHSTSSQPFDPSNGQRSFLDSRASEAPNKPAIGETFVAIKNNTSPSATRVDPISDTSRPHYPVQPLSAPQASSAALHPSQTPDAFSVRAPDRRSTQPLYQSRHAPGGPAARHPPHRDTAAARELREARLKHVFETRPYAKSAMSQTSMSRSRGDEPSPGIQKALKPQSVISPPTKELSFINSSNQSKMTSSHDAKKPTFTEVASAKVDKRELSPGRLTPPSFSPSKSMGTSSDHATLTKNGSHKLSTAPVKLTHPIMEDRVPNLGHEAHRESQVSLAGSDETTGEIRSIMEDLRIDDIKQRGKEKVTQQSQIFSYSRKVSPVESRVSATRTETKYSTEVSKVPTSAPLPKSPPNMLGVAQGYAESRVVKHLSNVTGGDHASIKNSASASSSSLKLVSKPISEKMPSAASQPDGTTKSSALQVKAPNTASTAIAHAPASTTQLFKAQSSTAAHLLDQPLVDLATHGIIGEAKPSVAVAKSMATVPVKSQQDRIALPPVAGYRACKRRVIIDNLPEDCSLEQISEIIFGGVVEEIIRVPGSTDCEVLFLSPDSANHFYEETANDIPWPSEPDRYLVVAFSQREDLYGELHRKLAANGATRTLVAINFDPKITQNHWEYFARQGGRSVQSVREGSVLDEEGQKHLMMDIRFATITDAVTFWTEMDLNPHLMGTRMAFSHDPCAYSRRIRT